MSPHSDRWVRSAIWALFLGGVGGAFLGFLARILYEPAQSFLGLPAIGWQPWLMASAILGSVTGLFFIKDLHRTSCRSELARAIMSMTGEERTKTLDLEKEVMVVHPFKSQRLSDLLERLSRYEKYLSDQILAVCLQETDRYSRLQYKATMSNSNPIAEERLASELSDIKTALLASLADTEKMILEMVEMHDALEARGLDSLESGPPLLLPILNKKLGEQIAGLREIYK